MDYLNKVICLFYPPLVNDPEFQPQTEVSFFSAKKDGVISQFLPEIVAMKAKKLVLLNYPQTEEQLVELQTELTKIGCCITNIILLNLENYDLLNEIQDEYLICPNCKRVFSKDKSQHKNGKLVCPWDGSNFTQDKEGGFSRTVLAEFFQNSKLLLEKILAGQKETRPIKINQLNNLHQKDFLREKNNWENEVKKRPGLFSDTKLLIVEQDILLLKAPTNDNVAFLAKNYQVDSQTICQKLFREKKNIIVISEEQ
ncbi:13770_t:CDS:2 [Gigaspora margarita]|uniref:13770_t:CDS:1 n=1 Tax=Gigaspora margarita TaxID=4874 RepID=A0ABM8VZU1_GIGMA|nr:13770_t:CDS:2 [Gigaspora margarita]